MYSESPAETGSIGVGIAVEPRYELCYGSPVGSQPTKTATRVLESYGLPPGDFKAFSPLPWGVGYAVSGSSAVAAGLAASYLLGRSVHEGLRRAHEVEVLDRTGLGDVLAISCGVGVVIRTRPGAPGIGSATCIYMPRSIVIVSIEMGSMSTSDLLSSLTDRYIAKARELLGKLNDSPTLDAFLEGVREFSDGLAQLEGLLGQEAAARLKGSRGVVSYYVKKRTAILVVERDAASDLVDLARSLVPQANIRLLEPSREGPAVR